MGDESPKAKDKNSKQHTAEKDKKNSAAATKQQKAAPDVKKGK